MTSLRDPFADLHLPSNPHSHPSRYLSSNRSSKHHGRRHATSQRQLQHSYFGRRPTRYDQGRPRQADGREALGSQRLPISLLLGDRRILLLRQRAFASSILGRGGDSHGHRHRARVLRIRRRRGGTLDHLLGHLPALGPKRHHPAERARLQARLGPGQHFLRHHPLPASPSFSIYMLSECDCRHRKGGNLPLSLFLPHRRSHRFAQHRTYRLDFGGWSRRMRFQQESRLPASARRPRAPQGIHSGESARLMAATRRRGVGRRAPILEALGVDDEQHSDRRWILPTSTSPLAGSLDSSLFTSSFTLQLPPPRRRLHSGILQFRLSQPSRSPRTPTCRTRPPSFPSQLGNLPFTHHSRLIPRSIDRLPHHRSRFASLSSPLRFGLRTPSRQLADCSLPTLDSLRSRGRAAGSAGGSLRSRVPRGSRQGSPRSRSRGLRDGSTDARVRVVRRLSRPSSSPPPRRTAASASEADGSISAAQQRSRGSSGGTRACAAGDEVRAGVARARGSGRGRVGGGVGGDE